MYKAKIILRLIVISIFSLMFYLLFHFTKVDEDKIFSLGKYLFTIATIFFPVLVSMILGVNFPSNIRVDIRISVKKDLKSMMTDNVIIFVLTSVTLLPLLLYSDEIKLLTLKPKEILLSIIIGFLSSSILYYIKRFFKLFHLNNQLDDASQCEDDD